MLLASRRGLARVGPRRAGASGDLAGATPRVVAARAVAGLGRPPRVPCQARGGISTKSPRAPAPAVLKVHRHYEGTLFRCSHVSYALGLEARFSVYVPDAPRAWTSLPYPRDTEAFPVLIYLSGLTCSDEDVITKANAQEHCAAEGLIFVAPDTSPGGAGWKDEGERFDMGLGAGYYLDATEEPWSAHNHMREYVEEELPAVVHAHFPTLGPEAVSIMGHCTGGMGALACALRCPKAYRSVSALAPIAHPTAVPSGSSPDVRRALGLYLGAEEASWSRYDPTRLAAAYDLGSQGPPPPLFIDVGADDEFLASGVLRPMEFLEACRCRGIPVDFRLRAGFDHSYFYVSSAMQDHIDFHAKYLAT